MEPEKKPARYAIIKGRRVRHLYCPACYREALRQCPIAPDEKTVDAFEGETCEEC